MSSAIRITRTKLHMTMVCLISRSAPRNGTTGLVLNCCLPCVIKRSRVAVLFRDHLAGLVRKQAVSYSIRRVASVVETHLPDSIGCPSRRQLQPSVPAFGANDVNHVRKSARQDPCCSLFRALARTRNRGLFSAEQRSILFKPACAAYVIVVRSYPTRIASFL